VFERQILLGLNGRLGTSGEQIFYSLPQRQNWKAVFSRSDALYKKNRTAMSLAPARVDSCSVG
jgi:hypothetical protein